jgi:hypothetical protein
MNNSEQKKISKHTSLQNISIYYDRFHYEYFNFVDFQYKQFIVCKI